MYSSVVLVSFVLARQNINIPELWNLNLTCQSSPKVKHHVQKSQIMIHNTYFYWRLILQLQSCTVSSVQGLDGLSVQNVPSFERTDKGWLSGNSINFSDNYHFMWRTYEYSFYTLLNSEFSIEWYVDWMYMCSYSRDFRSCHIL